MPNVIKLAPLLFCVFVYVPTALAKPKAEPRCSAFLTQPWMRAAEQKVATTLRFLGDDWNVPQFELHPKKQGTWPHVKILEREIHVPKRSTLGVIAHEVGHLVFLEALRRQAPDAYQIIMAFEHGPSRKRLERLDRLINAYSEPFCDLLGMMVIRKSSIFFDSGWAATHTDRDWAKPIVMPWDRAHQPSVNFKSSLPNDYIRFSEYRRILWHDYHSKLFGSRTQQKKILRAVLAATISELKQTIFENINDQERNRRLSQAVLRRLARLKF